MLEIRQTTQFKRDVKRSEKRGKNFFKFKEIIEILMAGYNLPEKYKDHQLFGNYIGSRECHIAPDWLLIYRIEGNQLVLIRMGTHSDLFS